MNLNKIKAWYRLIDQKSIGNALAHKIINDLGDPMRYVGQKSDLWANIDYISPEIKNIFQQDIDPPHWAKIINYLENSPNFQFISYLDENYPKPLKNIYQPPLYLTAIGDVSLLENQNTIGIVGTRKPTQYGRYSTEKIVNSLVQRNFIICSGLALGIDAVSHRKTLELNGMTIAVLACGLDIVYPPQNKELAHRIMEKGLVISENTPCVPFEKFHFPQRNRIISGLSKAVCIIEGSVQSGAMITAKFALEQNKEVYALPGDILRPEAQGPNSLISKGAKIILTPDDIAMDLSIDYQGKEVIKKIELNEDEEKIYNIIKEYASEIHIDQIIVETSMSIGEISGILFMLELKNAVRTTENGKYAINI